MKLLFGKHILHGSLLPRDVSSTIDLATKTGRLGGREETMGSSVQEQSI